MFIVHLAAELAPIAKVGGLSDVILGLSHELMRKGHQVAIILPKYDCMDTGEVEQLEPIDDNLFSLGAEGWVRNTVWVGLVQGLPVFFIEPHNTIPYFTRGIFYGSEDDTERFLYFSRAALEFLLKSGKHPDILHLHDWQTATAALLYREIFQKIGLHIAGIVLTIHNLFYQGLCSTFDLDRIGLNGSLYLQKHLLADPKDTSLINLLKGGIVYASEITTVSPNYAKEVQTPLGGCGLDEVLSSYAYKFSGILNGLDNAYWNPEIDHYLPLRYTPQDPFINKTENKRLLRKRLSMDPSERPIVACISRLVPQKGTDLIYHAIFRTLEKGGQFILLGTSPIPEITAQFRQLKVNLGANPHIHLELNYNEELSHQIYAGADLFIVPSLFEPCGLTQLIALKYGTIPVVRQTGGLADTIFDIDCSDKPSNETNGYTFAHPDNAGLNSALDRALTCWFHNPIKWQQLMLNGMKMDFSWNRPCDDYLALYHRLLS